MNAQVQLPIDSAAKIYLMRNDFGLYKIGISINPEDRRAQIENSSGVPVTILEVFDSADAYQEEQALHLELKDVRRCGEWFALGDDKAARECISLGLNRIRKAPESELPIERTTTYQMGIEDVEQALKETGSNLYSDRGQVHLFYRERLLVGAPAMKVAAALAHSSLIKAGYYRPDRSVICQYLEALALLRPKAPEASELLNQWIAECCHAAQGLTAPAGALFASWRRYAEAAGEQAGSIKRFSQAMRDSGYSPYRTSEERGFRNVALRASGDEFSKSLSELPKQQSDREMTATELLQLIGWPTSRKHQIRAGATLRAIGVPHRIINGRTVYQLGQLAGDNRRRQPAPTQGEAPCSTTTMTSQASACAPDWP